MNEKNLLPLLIKYFRQHLPLFLAAGAAVLIFVSVFSLYSLPMEAVVYAAILSAVVFLIVGSFSFVSFYNKHRTLEGLQNQITIPGIDLPQPKGQIEKDYQELLCILERARTSILFENDRSLTEMTDYYTLWTHQIKTPIAAMGLLLQTDESEKNREYWEQLFKIDQYVEMLLQYLRMEGPASDLIIRRYSLDAIVKQAVRKTSKLFIRKKIKLEMAELDHQVLTDEKWLSFVIEQLLTNALKYTPEGLISLSMDDILPKTLVIRDTGIGIQPEDLPRVFEKGYTGYNGRTGQKSTGIGLYLCKKVLDKLSHRITIESEVGIGTTVKIGLEVNQ